MQRPPHPAASHSPEAPLQSPRATNPSDPPPPASTSRRVPDGEKPSKEFIADGTECTIDGRLRVHYNGYFIKVYPVPEDNLIEKRRLIAALTRRLFNHVEHGLYVPGSRLNEARRAYDSEADPDKKRIKGGMLAGALFNSAAEILTKLVELQSMGVEISPSDPLMRRCGEHLQEALTLGRSVRHRSGEEGIDELWGEPFKAFAYPIREFYRSRYVKLSMTMRCIDDIAESAGPALSTCPGMKGVEAPMVKLAEAAKDYAQTLRSDADVFECWSTLAVARERLDGYRAKLPRENSSVARDLAVSAEQLAREV